MMRISVLSRCNVLPLLAIAVLSMCRIPASFGQQQSAVTTELQLSIQSHRGWSTVPLQDIQTRVALSVNCECPAAPTLLAISARVDSPTEGKVVGDVLITGAPYLAKAELSRECPATIRVLAAVGPFNVSGALAATVREGKLYFGGELWEQGKAPESSQVRLSVSYLPGQPTTFCPSTSGSSSTKEATSSSGNEREASGTNHAVTYAFNRAVQDSTTRPPEALSPHNRFVDPLGRLASPAIWGSATVDSTQSVSPPCPLGSAIMNPNNQGVACDGSSIASMSIGPFLTYYSPAYVNDGPGFWGIPGLISSYDYRIDLTSDSALIRLITPTGEKIDLLKQGNGSEYKPHNPLWDVLATTLVRYDGPRAMSITAIIGGAEWVFRRTTQSEPTFNLVSITRGGRTFYQRVGTTPNDPTGVWLGNEQGASLYSVEKTQSEIIFRLRRTLNAVGLATAHNRIVARLTLKNGTIESIVSEDYATTFKHGTLASGSAVITALMAGPLQGPLDYWQSWTVDRTGRLLSFSTGGNDSPPHRTTVRYTDTEITVSSDESSVVRYQYSTQNGTPLLTRTSSQQGELRYFYDQKRGNALVRSEDSRFLQPVYELVTLDPGRAFIWRDLRATYDANLATLSSNGSYRIVTTPSNPTKPESTVVVRVDENSRTHTVSQGKVAVSTISRLDSNGLTTNTVVTVDQKVVDDRSLVEELRENGDGLINTISLLEDRLTGAQTRTHQAKSKSMLTSSGTVRTPAGLSFTSTSNLRNDNNTLYSSVKSSLDGRALTKKATTISPQTWIETSSQGYLGSFSWLTDVMRTSRENGSEQITRYQVWEDQG